VEKSTKVMSLRVPVDLAAWAESYAEQRGVKRVVLLETALTRLREAVLAGDVPDLVVRERGAADSSASFEAPKSAGSPRREQAKRVLAAVQASSAPGRPVEPPLDLAAIEAKAAAAAARARAERARRYEERGW
jgi:hypothetical protein